MRCRVEPALELRRAAWAPAHLTNWAPAQFSRGRTWNNQGRGSWNSLLHMGLTFFLMNIWAWLDPVRQAHRPNKPPPIIGGESNAALGPPTCSPWTSDVGVPWAWRTPTCMHRFNSTHDYCSAVYMSYHLFYKLGLSLHIKNNHSVP